MSVREDAATMLLQGKNPMQIALEMRKDIIEIKRYLLTQVGEGGLRLSDILFSIPDTDRESFETLIKKHGTTDHWTLRNVHPRPFRSGSINEGMFRIYVACRNSERGDMYVYISDIEILLHNLVQTTLLCAFGDGENGWWRQGVPSQIRKTCVALREDDPMPAAEPFAYTTFINLSEIIDRNWPVFLRVLPAIFTENKRRFLQDLVKLNALRNCVMHPIKRVGIRRDDFEFVNSFLKTLQNVTS